MRKSLGPWTTAIDSGATLSAFWKQRITRLPDLTATAPRLSRRAYAALTFAAILALGWPTAHLTREVAAADSPSTADAKPKPVEQAQKQGQPFAVDLEDGVRVELVGLCEHPSEDKAWWAADGQPAAAPYQTLRASSPRQITREIALSWHVPENRGITTRWYVKKCSVWSGGTPENVAGKHPQDLRAAAFAMQEATDVATVELSVAAGQWQTMTETRGRGFGSEGKWAGGKRTHGFAYSPAIEHDGRVTVTISHDVLKRDLRIIAVDASGKMLADGGGNGGGSGGFMQTTGIFHNISLKDIHAFQLQARPFHRYEIQNVSLKRDQQTTPMLIDLGVDDKDPPPEAAS